MPWANLYRLAISKGIPLKDFPHMTLAQLHYATADLAEDTRPMAPVGHVMGAAVFGVR